MPALLLPHTRFLHVPKTGGNWVSGRLRELFPQACHMPKTHTTLRSAPEPGRFTFAFVRHPLTWYQSYFAYKQRTGWDLNTDWDRRVHADSFEGFVNRALDETPGHYSRLVRSFVGRRGAEIDFIGRFEQLRPDLIRALQLAGEVFDPDPIRSAPPVNASDYRRHPAEYPDGLARRVLDVEAEVVERFYAESLESVSESVEEAASFPVCGLFQADVGSFGHEGGASRKCRTE